MNVVLDRVWDIALELNKSVKLYNKHFVTTCMAWRTCLQQQQQSICGLGYLDLFRFNRQQTENMIVYLNV